MVDKAGGEVSLTSAWRSLGQRAAVAGGSGVALLSLLAEVPASTVALRGGATWLALLLVTRLGAVALRIAWRLDAAAKERVADGARTDPTREAAR